MTIFDPDAFRRILDDPAMIGSFDASYPEARSLFEQYLSSLRPTFPPFPLHSEMTALQISLFDNGGDEAKPSAAKRPRKRKLPRQRTRYVLNMKAWTKKDVRLDAPNAVSWEASAYLWTAGDAALHITDLTNRKLLVSGRAIEQFRELAANALPTCRFGIPSQHDRKMGSRWVSDFLVYAATDPNDPSEIGVALFTPFGTLKVADVDFTDETARGNPLPKKVIAQARLSFHPNFERWGSNG